MSSNNGNLFPALLAKLASANPNNSETLSEILSELPDAVQSKIKPKISQYGKETDLEKLVGQNGNGNNGNHKEKGKNSRFEVYWAKDAFKPLPPIDWIIEGLFSPGSVSVFFGEPGAKKTLALLDAMVCIVLGKNWLKFKTKKGNTLFIDEDNGPRRLRDRITKTILGHGGKENVPLAFTTYQQLNVRKCEDISNFAQLIKSIEAHFVVIDALACVIPGADENAVKDIQPGFMSLRQVAEKTQAAIAIIHHTYLLKK